MFKTSLILRTVSVALLSLFSSTRVSAVCGTNQIGLANAPVSAVIVNTTCGVIDQKEPGDFDFCGDYRSGSQVTCNTPSTPSTVHTLDGRDWGNCVSTSERCGSPEVSDQPIVEWCCSEL